MGTRAIFLIRHGRADRSFEIREQPDLLPLAGQIRIQVEASGLNFADVLARLGLYPEAPALPSILGYEVVGRIDALGRDVNDLRVGQRVVAFTRFGGYASTVLTTPVGVFPIPDSMPAGVAAALATQYTTAYFSAEVRAGWMPGDRVLVHAAAGGLGTALVQLARLRGCRIAGTAGSAVKLEYLRAQGVDCPINYREADFVREFRQWSEGAGADVIFDSIGGDVFRQGLRLLAPDGRIVGLGVGQMSGTRKSSVRALRTVLGFGMIHPISLLSQSKSVIGVNMLRIADSKPTILKHCMAAVIQLAVEGKVHPVADRDFPAEEIGSAHEYLASRRSVGKVVIRWNA